MLDSHLRRSPLFRERGLPVALSPGVLSQALRDRVDRAGEDLRIPGLLYALNLIDAMSGILDWRVAGSFAVGVHWLLRHNWGLLVQAHKLEHAITPQHLRSNGVGGKRAIRCYSPELILAPPYIHLGVKMDLLERHRFEMRPLLAHVRIVRVAWQRSEALVRHT